MSQKLPQAVNVAVLRAAIKAYGLRCHVSPDEGLFRFQEKGQQTVHYFPKKNRYRLAGDPTSHFANANEFIDWYIGRPEMRNHVIDLHAEPVTMPPDEAKKIVDADYAAIEERIVAGMGYTPEDLKSRAYRGGDATKNRMQHQPSAPLGWVNPVRVIGTEPDAYADQPQDDQGAAPCSTN